MHHLERGVVFQWTWCCISMDFSALIAGIRSLLRVENRTLLCLLWPNATLSSCKLRWLSKMSNTRRNALLSRDADNIIFCCVSILEPLGKFKFIALAIRPCHPNHMLEDSSDFNIIVVDQFEARRFPSSRHAVSHSSTRVSAEFMPEPTNPEAGTSWSSALRWVDFTISWVLTSNNCWKIFIKVFRELIKTYLLFSSKSHRVAHDTVETPLPCLVAIE